MNFAKNDKGWQNFLYFQKRVKIIVKSNKNLTNFDNKSKFQQKMTKCNLQYVIAPQTDQLS